MVYLKCIKMQLLYQRAKPNFNVSKNDHDKEFSRKGCNWKIR